LNSDLQSRRVHQPLFQELKSQDVVATFIVTEVEEYVFLLKTRQTLWQYDL